MVGKKKHQPVALSDGNNSPLEDPKKAVLLAVSLQTKGGQRPTLRQPLDLDDVTTNASSNPGIPEFTQPFRAGDMEEVMTTN